MKKVKITVLRKYFYTDLADAYLSDGKDVGSCPLLEESDSFIFEGSAVMPKGFCPWAWIDIYAGVSAISSGASYTPWQNKENMTIRCCTDGIRPVIFSIEALSEEINDV